MASKTLSLSLSIFFQCFLSLSQAYTFYVGGKDGWVLNPSESYDNWTNRNRFRVNDVLVFNYARGSDSVAVVGKEDYDKCDLNNPIVKLEDGNSKFKFDRSGAFYFASGKHGMCENGQKLAVVVISQHSFSLSSKLASTPPEVSPTLPLSSSETLGSPMPSSEIQGLLMPSLEIQLSSMPSSEALGSPMLSSETLGLPMPSPETLGSSLPSSETLSSPLPLSEMLDQDPTQSDATGEATNLTPSDPTGDSTDPTHSDSMEEPMDPTPSYQTGEPAASLSFEASGSESPTSETQSSEAQSSETTDSYYGASSSSGSYSSSSPSYMSGAEPSTLTPISPSVSPSPAPAEGGEPSASPSPAPAEGGEPSASPSPVPAEGGEPPASPSPAPAEGGEPPAEGGEPPADSFAIGLFPSINLLGSITIVLSMLINGRMIMNFI